MSEPNGWPLNKADVLGRLDRHTLQLDTLDGKVDALSTSVAEMRGSGRVWSAVIALIVGGMVSMAVSTILTRAQRHSNDEELHRTVNELIETLGDERRARQKEARDNE